MTTVNFCVVDPRTPFVFWRDAQGGVFTRATAEAFAERHNAILAANVPDLDGERYRVFELLPAGHRQRVCELSVELDDADFKVWSNRLHELAHE